MVDFLTTYKKPIGLTVASIFLLAIGFALGRFGVAEKVVVQERVELVEVVHEVVVEKEKIVEKRVYDSNEQSRIHREERTINHPDGTTVTTKTEDINVDKVVKDVEIKEIEKQVIVEKEVEKIVEKQVLVSKDAPMPDWRISGILSGRPMDMIDTCDTQNCFDSAALGVQLDRRIVGPLFLGVNGYTNGQVGVSLGLEF